MFFHNFKYALKTLFKNKMLIFWTFAFPIILGTFFKMAFQDIEANETLSIIEIGIVNNDTYETNAIWKETFRSLSDSTKENQIFNIHYGTVEEQKRWLEEESICGYILVEEEPLVVVKESGIEQTVLKQTVDEIIQTEALYESIVDSEISEYLSSFQNTMNMEELIVFTINKIQTFQANFTVPLKDNSSKNMSYTMIEYYTLIAMACLYGGILGMVSVNKNLANMGSVGKRVSVSKVKKGTLILSSVLASFLTQIIGVSLLFLFTIFILKVDYGNRLFYVLGLAFTGCLSGLSLGIATSCFCKCNENIKTGLILAITMTGCFLSGMMGITMKYIIDRNIPLLNRINPANRITDGFYSLYYYQGLERFYKNLISLLIFSGFLILCSIFVLRRQKYDSI